MYDGCVQRLIENFERKALDAVCELSSNSIIDFVNFKNVMTFSRSLQQALSIAATFLIYFALSDKMFTFFTVILCLITIFKKKFNFFHVSILVNTEVLNVLSFFFFTFVFVININVV